MSGNKKVYNVQIAGLSFTLRSSHDEGTVQKMTQLVDKKIKEAISANSHASFQNALILAGLHLAEDYVILKDSTKAELQNLQENTLEILSEIKSAPKDTDLS